MGDQCEREMGVAVVGGGATAGSVGGRWEGGRAAQYLALLEANTNLGDC